LKKLSKFEQVSQKVTPPGTLELLAFDEYCRFDISALFWEIKLGSLYPPEESRNNKTAVFIES
jgi:hypothetical protein